jgi:hypothetical protein
MHGQLDLAGLLLCGALCLGVVLASHHHHHHGPPALGIAPRGGLLHPQHQQHQQHAPHPPLPPPLSEQQQQQQQLAPLAEPQDALVREGDTFHLPLVALQHGLTDALAWNDVRRRPGMA